jgi:hypothetical protein
VTMIVDVAKWGLSGKIGLPSRTPHMYYPG